ncbi:hypothetical protein LCGC14_1631530 [marine sediment metagenome]|uniref:N-acetyltransferase domain-containing protein n=1 Tax=marine sediment metagenome TaxID=412755 RepID=A0A0F9I2G9_9ZZZZ
MMLDVLSKEDCEQVRLWRNQCLETLRTPYPLTKEMQEDFYRDVVMNPHSKHKYYAIKMHEDVLIGMGGLTNIEWENSQAEISLIINPALQKQGHGKEAVRLLLDQAFNYLNLELVYGECYECNSAADFWRNIGAKYDAHFAYLNKRKCYNGTHFGTVYFDVKRDDFAAMCEDMPNCDKRIAEHGQISICSLCDRWYYRKKPEQREILCSNCASGLI